MKKIFKVMMVSLLVMVCGIQKTHARRIDNEATIKATPRFIQQKESDYQSLVRLIKLVMVVNLTR
jgi:hypothetical protein